MITRIISTLLLLLAASISYAEPIFIEAESFASQTLDQKRKWYVFSATSAPKITPDGDPPHLEGASGGSYIELLPDTRRSHDDKLIKGENFIDEGGKMAVLSYKVKFPTAGRYYVWVRVYSTTTEDNGLHFGLNGKWPESGARWQTVQKNGWHWDCKQRTAKVHAGVPMQLWLDVEKAGENELLMSMREDGIEVDQIALTTDVKWRPEGFKERADAAAPATSAKPPGPALVQPRKPDGSGAVVIGGELKQWHKVTLTLDGPYAHERDTQPNPFTDLALSVTFTHESGSPKYIVPGYFAADGDAANSSAESGTKWRAHLSPDKPGKWSYTVSFTKGDEAAIGGKAIPLKPFDGQSGSFNVGVSDKTGRDFRAKGRLQYVGKHHLRFAGTGEYFLKAGPDSPENLLAYVDFDGTRSHKARQARAGEAVLANLKTWEPHVQDWKAGDPTWKDGKGKGMIGALNYLAGKGCNSFSFLPYNAGGDGDDVWPFIERDYKFNYDCSKLDQWQVVFDHGQKLGLYLHFKLQETENDDLKGPGAAQSLDGGDLGTHRKLYLREIIARFGYALALNWNLGEENTQSPAQQRAMAKYILDIDPYDHHIVIHTYPNDQDKVYTQLVGDQSVLTGASLQNSWNTTHQRTLKWIGESVKAGRPWVVANDEQGPANLGAPPDPGFAGFAGKAGAKDGKGGYDLHDIRQATLWGNLMAGGAGVEYYFGYQLPQNDLNAQDFRSRDKSWDYCRIALEFFRDNRIPFWEMNNANALIGNEKNDNSKYCFAKSGDVYLVYLPSGGTTDLDLAGVNGTFTVKWFNPRNGGELMDGSVKSLEGGKPAALGNPPADAGEDWLVVIRR